MTTDYRKLSLLVHRTGTLYRHHRRLQSFRQVATNGDTWRQLATIGDKWRQVAHKQQTMIGLYYADKTSDATPRKVLLHHLHQCWCCRWLLSMGWCTVSRSTVRYCFQVVWIWNIFMLKHSTYFPKISDSTMPKRIRMYDKVGLLESLRNATLVQWQKLVGW